MANADEDEELVNVQSLQDKMVEIPPEKEKHFREVHTQNLLSQQQQQEGQHKSELEEQQRQQKLKEEERQKKKKEARRRVHDTCGSCPEHFYSSNKSIAAQDSDSTEVESSTEEEERWKDIARAAEIPADYYNIQKLIKYIKAGNQTATIVSLCCLRDYDLRTQINQMAVHDIGGLEVLVNILECTESHCCLGALYVLSEISLNIDIRKTIVDLGGVPLIVDILSALSRDLKTMAAETLANVSKVRLARKYVRSCNGIPKLVDMLDVNLRILKTPREELNASDLECLYMARAGARALWSLSLSRHNKELMRKSGIVPLMARLLKSCHTDVVIPIMGTIQECASQPKFQLAITTEGMIADIVTHLQSDSLDLKTEGSTAIYKCAFDQTTRDLVRSAGGLEPLVAIIKDKNVRDNKKLMIGAAGAIWMCAVSDANVKKLDSLRLINHLVPLLNDDSDDVITNVVGAIAECVRFQNNREVLRAAGGLPALVSLLNSSHPPLLVNLAKALKECAEDLDSMRILEDLDAVRLTWSLLKNTDTQVQAYAAYAICPCVRNARESGELVRSLVGAMELVVDLLKSPDTQVLSAVCAAIATIARDTTNLAILTDLKVIYKLADLVNTNEDMLRENLAAAIASCATFGNNTQELGLLRTVTPIVSYLTSNNPAVHRTTAMALENLSTDPQNCIIMHQSGVVPFLLECVGSTNKETQLAAAGCLRNIRELALRAEEYLLKIDEEY
ncbi:armadillo repeat-containing protein gudu [Anastrepha obliqua]|uniref:armadillo repeat-containing protein gudu n=1 Tax=Anastrepha obliqua TaxID=95512 RepID=UPI00240A933C|nr:armadillo repeat-containing protein gudu [Anastrepha obliqua]